MSEAGFTDFGSGANGFDFWLEQDGPLQGAGDELPLSFDA
jgi:hypothetical protein